MINLIIVDDNKRIINGLVSILNSFEDMYVRNTFYNSQDLLEYLTESSCDVLLLDINLPDINGIEVCKIISRLYPDIKIIALTSHNELSIVNSMMRNGAKGYLQKNATLKEIVDAIREVYIGNIYLQKIIEDKLRKEYTENLDKTVSFTRSEKQILKLLLQNKNNYEIAELLDLSIEKIFLYTNQIFDKLNINSRKEFLESSNALKSISLN